MAELEIFSLTFVKNPPINEPICGGRPFIAARFNAIVNPDF